MKLQLIFIFILFTTSFTYSDTIETVAILQIEANGTSLYAAKAVENAIQNELSKNTSLITVERTRLDELLNEQKLGLSGVT